MLKVHILDRCPHCDGRAYLPSGEAIDSSGKPYTRHTPCPMCQGTGERGKWVSLPEFLELIQAIQCKHEHTSHQGGYRFSAGEVWDTITEVCIDCGADLDKQTSPLHGRGRNSREGDIR